MELWNVKDLQCPPINSCKVPTKEIDLKLLNCVLAEAIEFFNNHPLLRTEAAMLSRIIYRMKMKFRSAKDFKSLQMLNRALLNYLQLDISNVLKTFMGSVPSKFKGSKTYLPTKGMLEYVLVRLQGLSKLLWRILEICKFAADLAQKRIHLGHFWKLAAIAYALVSRIFVIMRNVIKYTCDLYSKLESFLCKLCDPGVPWLPEGYVLPHHLSDWLNIDWLDLETTVIEIPDEEPNIVSYFNLIDDSDDDDIEISDEYVVINDESSILNLDESFEDIVNSLNKGSFRKVKKDDAVSLNTLRGFDDNVDMGEVIDLSDSDSLKSEPLKRKLDEEPDFQNPKRLKISQDSEEAETESDDSVIILNPEHSVILDDKIPEKIKSPKNEKLKNMELENSLNFSVADDQSVIILENTTASNKKPNSASVVDGMTSKKIRSPKKKKEKKSENALNSNIAKDQNVTILENVATSNKKPNSTSDVDNKIPKKRKLSKKKKGKKKSENAWNSNIAKDQNVTILENVATSNKKPNSTSDVINLNAKAKKKQKKKEKMENIAKNIENNNTQIVITAKNVKPHLENVFTKKLNDRSKATNVNKQQATTSKKAENTRRRKKRKNKKMLQN